MSFCAMIDGGDKKEVIIGIISLKKEKKSQRNFDVVWRNARSNSSLFVFSSL